MRKKIVLLILLKQSLFSKVRALNGIFVDLKDVVSDEIPNVSLLMGLCRKDWKKKRKSVLFIRFLFLSHVGATFTFFNVHRRKESFPLFLKPFWRLKRKGNNVRADESHVFLVLDSSSQLWRFLSCYCVFQTFSVRMKTIVPFVILVTTRLIHLPLICTYFSP